MRSIAGTIRTHDVCVGIEFIIDFPSMYLHVRGIFWMVSCSRPTLHILLRETGSTLDIRVVPYNVA